MSRTFNRLKLRKLCEAGRLVLVGSYHFDDLHGGERTTKEMPVRMRRGHGAYEDGVCLMREGDFSGPPGRAWLNEDGTVHLHVHSNCNYTFRIQEANEQYAD